MVALYLSGWPSAMVICEVGELLVGPLEKIGVVACELVPAE
jgi:hypothetical protein